MRAFSALTATLLCVAGCSSEPKSATVPLAAAPLTVRVAEVVVANGQDSVSGTGTVRFRRETQLGFNTGGRLQRLTVREGDRVVPGQPLAALDAVPVSAAMASAAAEARRADADLRRMRGLAANGWVTRARLESAEASAQAAAAAVRARGFDARYATITASTQGVVLRRLAEPGQMMAVGTPVVTLGETASGFVLRVPLPDSEVTRLTIGSTAEVRLPALSPAPIAARVQEIAARGDDRTGTFQVELALPSVPGLRSGLVGDTRIAARPTAAVHGFIVPASAIFAARADEGFVYVVTQGRVYARMVGVGAVSDAGISVTSGLRAGERVVTSGVDRLSEGASVKIATGA